MDICCQRAANRQPVGAGLLLCDAPLARPPFLRCQQVADERRPHDAGLYVDDPAGAIERTHAIGASHVEHQRLISELLGAHRMPSAGDADGLS